MVEREELVLPEGGNKLLLHSCCAPCSGEVMEALLASGIDFSIFFYNFQQVRTANVFSNLQPQQMPRVKNRHFEEGGPAGSAGE